jgi:hypothetical protein
MRLEIWRTARKDEIHTEEINKLLAADSDLTQESYGQQKQIEGLEATLHKQLRARMGAGMQIMMMLHAQRSKTAVVQAVQAFRLNFYQERQRAEMAAYEKLSSHKMAQFTASALALQARLEQRLNHHSWKQAFTVLIRMLDRLNKAPLLYARQTWRYNMVSSMRDRPPTTAPRGDYVIRGMQRMRHSLGHVIMSPVAIKGVLLTWYWQMLSATKLTLQKRSAIEGIDFAHSRGMKTLSGFFKQMLRSNVSNCVFVWRRNVSLEKDAKYRDIRIKYEAQSRHFSQLFKR